MAIERSPYPGGWYGENLPNRRFVVGYEDGHFDTSEGPFFYPLQIIDTRINPIVPGFAGIPQGNPNIIELINNQFLERGPSCGIDACAYWPNGTLEIVRQCIWPPYGSLGIRWIDDSIHTGAETYTQNGDGIAEYTIHDDIKVGQGQLGGIVIKYLGVRRLIEQGNFRFIRFNYDPATFTLAIYAWEMTRGFAVLYWFNVSDISTFEIQPYPPIPVPPDDNMIEPKVEVKHWDLNELLDGREFHVRDSNNPDLGYEARVFVRNGSMFCELKNSKGLASTGLIRPVKKCPEVPVPPDPNPNPNPDPVIKKYWFKSVAWGNYLYVDENNIIQRGDKKTAFIIEDLPNNEVAIKAVKYTAAEPPTGLLKADRDTPSDWERFIKGTNSFGTNFKALSTGKFVGAHGDGPVLADRTEARDQEAFILEEVKLVGPEIQIVDKFFRNASERFTGIETSEFSIFKRYLDNDALVLPVLEQRASVGFNLLRVWLLNDSVVSLRNGGGDAGIHPNQYPDFYDKLSMFCDLASSYGLGLEITAFTQTQTLMPKESDQQLHLNATADAVRGKANAIVELVNENDQHDNAVSSNLTRPSGIIISHGSAGADNLPPRPTWSYELYHSNDLNEWWRKVGHNAMERADESGVPAMSNENTRYPDKESSETRAYDAAAGAALLCAGACFHSQSGKFSRLFDATELRCATEWVKGAKSVPLEFQDGSYRHRQDLETPEFIRVYSRTLGDGREYIVKIRA